MVGYLLEFNLEKDEGGWTEGEREKEKEMNYVQ